MPSITCRDFGVDCDNFIQVKTREDIGELLIADVKHLDEAHPKEWEKILAAQKPWQILAYILKLVKP